MNTTFAPVTYSDIRELRDEALAHGDYEMAATADVAMSTAKDRKRKVEIAAAWRQCVSVILDARAQQ